MTDSEKLSVLNVMVEGETDETLLTYLSIAGSKILDRLYPYGHRVVVDGEEIEDQTVPDRYAYLQCEIAAYLLNKRGAEGQTSHSENGVSRSYGSDDIPTHLITQVVPFVGV